MSTKRVHVIVRGRVTGVFFRAAAQREARRLGITGWVKNRPDGGVEILAEAEEDAVKEMISWAQRGPSAGAVTPASFRTFASSNDERGRLSSNRPATQGSRLWVRF